MGNLIQRNDPTVNLLPGSNQALAEGDPMQEIVTRYQYNAFGQLVQTEDPRGNIDLYSYFPENDRAPSVDGRISIDAWLRTQSSVCAVWTRRL